MKSLRISLIIILILSLFGATDMAAQSVNLTISTADGQKKIGVGDRFYIEIHVKNVDGDPQQPASVPGANILYFTRSSQSSSFSSINGNVTQSISSTWTITLRAQAEGKYTFGPITVGGVKSNTLNYTIGAPLPEQQPAAQQSPATNPAHPSSDKPEYIGHGNNDLFLRAQVSQTNAFVNQALLYTVKLYSSYDAIKFIGATASPKFDGFVVEESKDISTSLTYETFNGRTYATAIIARYIIFPQHEGQLSVKGNTYTVSVDQREYYRDPFFGSMAYSKPLQLNVTPNDLTVNVKSLPTPVPADFSGGVGQFSIRSELPAQSFVSNQAANIDYVVTGTGNIKYVTLPDLTKIFPPELEVYTPTTESDVNVGKTSVSGTMRFDYSFMPLEGGTFKLPDVKLVYFNPTTGQYETSVAKGYEISVERGTGSEKSQTKAAASFDSQLMPVTTSLKFEHRPYVLGFPYWLFYIIPIGVIIIAYVWYKSYLAANSDLIAVRSRKANRMARRRLKRAYGYMKANDRNNFYDEIVTSLWGYVSDKLSIPASELSRDNVSGKLAMRDIPDDDVKKLIDLIDDVEFEKYAPSASASEMSDIYDKTIEMMNTLEDDFKKARNNEEF